jgi:hypothetical protein
LSILIPPPRLEIRFHEDDLFAARVRSFLWGAFLGIVAGAAGACVLLDAIGRLR